MKKFLIILFFSTQLWSLECIIAFGFPPFQFEENSTPTGLDAEMIKLFSQYHDEKIKIKNMQWDKALSEMYYSENIKCIWGMEITPKRKKRYLFSAPIYTRHSTLFILASSKIKELTELSKKIISGDKDSELERELRENPKYESLRIMQPESKVEAIKLLKEEKISAVIMPYRVGKYFEKEYKIKLKALMKSKKETDVAIGIKKDQTELIIKINKTLKRIPKDKIENIY